MTRFITTMTSLRTYFLSCCLRQHPDRSSLRKEGIRLAHSSVFSQSITGEKARLRESEAADHTASIIRKQEMQARPQLVFSILHILESPVQGMICPQFRWILPYYLTQSRYPPTSMLRGLSPRWLWILSNWQLALITTISNLCHLW